MFWCLFGRTVLMSFCLILMDLEIIYNFNAGYRILLSVWYKRNLGGENGVILQGMKSLWTQWALAEVLVFISLLGDEWDVKPVTCLMGDPILLHLTNPLGFILLSVIKLYRWKFVALLWCIWRGNSIAFSSFVCNWFTINFENDIIYPNAEMIPTQRWKQCYFLSKYTIVKQQIFIYIT